MMTNASSKPLTSATPRVYALIPAAGSGNRMGSNLPKQYQSLAGKPMLAHTLAAFSQSAGLGVDIALGVLVLAPDDKHAQNLLPQLPMGVFQAHWVGGTSRAQSVLHGLQTLKKMGAQPTDWVLVHDAARCLVAPEAITALVKACWDDTVGGLLAQPVSDTLKQAQSGRVLDTLPRSDKWQAQTPQMFRLGLLLKALSTNTAQTITDEASAVEALGLQPKLVANHSVNFKITYPQDFALAQAFLQQDTQSQTTQSCLGCLRIGEGFDVHALVDAADSGRKLMLGGVHIPFAKALAGHSDADVLLHAITDALLGAAALGDIGRHFPDTDAAYKESDSRVLLQTAAARVAKAGFSVVNVDATVIAQTPKLMPYIAAMVQSVACCLGLAPAQVNIKAKTAENLGPVGEGLSMEARAVVLLTQTVKQVHA